MQNDLLQNKWKKEQFLLLPRILQIMKQVIQRYETKGFSVIKSVESRGSLIQCPINRLLILIHYVMCMLHYINFYV